MLAPCVTVVIPTLTADDTLVECVRSLEAQSRRDFEVIIVDNSGQQLVRRRKAAGERATVIENTVNAGFGGAINQAFHQSSAPFLATLNDDAVADPNWVASLMAAVEKRPDVGMWASQVRLFPSGKLDSAGMLVSGDGSSKQRGHLGNPTEYGELEEALLPSGSAALYRRKMLEEIGLFDEDFFLYCEDTDLGLRARWAGWKCLYVPAAIVDHHYSHSAGRVSSLKAYYVERNRLFAALKNFPLSMLLAAPGYAAVRYFWHVAMMFQGKGAAAEYRQSGSGLTLLWLVLKAHAAAIGRLPALLRQRRQIRKNARMTAAEFSKLLAAYSISPRQVASL
ncbi:MAG: glycosyltransferase family 2 protein [Bryobacteraceae bacterium]